MVFPSPEVINDPSISALASSPPASVVPSVFHACTMMHAQACEMGETVDLPESFMATLDESEFLL